MPTVDFVYADDCPHVKTTRANLMRAFANVGLSPRWKEHAIGSADAPAHVEGYGSPTVLVDGVDVAGQVPGSDACCRLYESGGAPSVDLIAAALAPAAEPGDGAEVPPSRGRWGSALAVLPGLGIALLPKVVCPFCWPAYAGLLSAAGLTFLMEDRWLLPISAIFLAAALAALGWRARARHGYGPLALGAASAVAILVGKFAMDSSVTVYVGITALVVACVWNLWPRRVAQPSCDACLPVPSD